VAGVQAHESTLAQVLFNLMSNALKFVVAGTPARVRLRTEERAGFIRIWVKNDGPGIAPEHQSQIFGSSPAWAARNIRARARLAIVQKGTERMGGRVGRGINTPVPRQPLLV